MKQETIEIGLPPITHKPLIETKPNKKCCRSCEYFGIDDGGEYCALSEEHPTSDQMADGCEDYKKAR